MYKRFFCIYSAINSIIALNLSKILVDRLVVAPVTLVWDCYNNPKHIIHLNYASEGWHCPHAMNDLLIGGEFLYRMELKDGLHGFD